MKLLPTKWLTARPRLDLDGSGLASRVTLDPRKLLSASSNDVQAFLRNLSAAGPEEIYRTQPNVRAVVDYRAAQIAQLGLHLFVRDGEDGRVRDRDSVAAHVLARPSLAQSTFDWIYSLAMDLALFDEALCMVTPRSDSPTGFEVRPIPHSTIVERKGSAWNGTRSVVVSDAEGRETTIPPDALFEIQGYDPYYAGRPISPLEALRGTLAEQVAAEAYRLGVWKNGGLFSSYVSRPAGAPQWTTEAASRFRADLQDYRTGGSKAGGFPVLEDGMDIRSMTVQAKEAQWAEAAELALETVCRVYRIPPSMVGATGGVTYANMREFRRMLFGEALGPTIRQIEGAINARLLPMLGAPEGAYAEMNIKEKLSASFEEQADVLQKATGGPFMTVNEARATQNLPTVEGGDVVRTPLNQGTLADDPEDAPEDPEPEPEDAPEASRSAEPETRAKVFEKRTLTAPPAEVEPVAEAFLEVFRRTIRRQRDVTLSALGAKAATRSALSWNEDRWNRELTEDLARAADAVAEELGPQVAAQLGYPDAFHPEATRNFLRAVAASRAALANDSLRRSVEAALAEEDGDVAHAFDVAAESNAVAMASSTAAAVTSWVAVEAGRHARRAIPAGRPSAATKTWIVRSGNPRPTHAHMGGETVPLDGTFSNGADWPGDRALSADETAGCMCGVEIEISEVVQSAS